MMAGNLLVRTRKYGISSYELLLAASLCLFFISLFVSNLAGLVLGGGWTAFCTLAAFRRDMIVWTILCLAPLVLIALLWLASRPYDQFFEWFYIMAFTGGCIVTAATGTLTLITAAPKVATTSTVSKGRA